MYVCACGVLEQATSSQINCSAKAALREAEAKRKEALDFLDRVKASGAGAGRVYYSVNCHLLYLCVCVCVTREREREIGGMAETAFATRNEQPQS